MNLLVVGAGLFGATVARERALKGDVVDVIEKRDHVAGNIYTESVEGIQVHRYGAHIFHTSNQAIWEYVNQFADFNRYTNEVIANYKGEIYNLPFNMNTFNKMWGVITPAEAQKKIAEQRAILADKKPENLEEQAISLVGTDIYKKLIKDYTAKQWGRDPKELPSFIIRRLPVRYTYDNNYFNDAYQGIPKAGYTHIVEKMLDQRNINVQLSTDFFANKEAYLDNY
ncbi:UDP-galactopyranose mutase, partial [Lacticaseibacillus paracasei subsp. paracasei Lpp126]